MEDMFMMVQQCVIDEILKTKDFVSNIFKVIDEKIESYRIENAETEQGTYHTWEMGYLLKKWNQSVVVIDQKFGGAHNVVSREFKVIAEKIKILKDRMAETKEGMFRAREMEDILKKEAEDILKKLQQTIIDEMSKIRVFVSEEHKVINERIESLKAETKLGRGFINLYAQESLIGEGNMGRVYKVRDLKTRKVCAMKSIGLEENILTPKVTREISTLFDIEHENIVKLEKVHSCEGSLYLMMEYAGDDLSTIIQKGGKFNVEIAKAWLRELLLAIDFLHKRDIIHCNLKPKNILIDSSLKLKIAGFGSVRRCLDDTTSSPVVPIIPYRAPELLLGSNDYGKPIDIWAIGCIFAEVVEGESLFGSVDKSDFDISILHEIFRKIGTPSQTSWLFSLPNFPQDVHQYPRASEIIPCLDAVGNDLIKKMLAVDPLERITAGDALKHPYIKSGTRLENWTD